MSISNVDRMREALVRDEINYLMTLSKDDLLECCKNMVTQIYEDADEKAIIEEYERME